MLSQRAIGKPQSSRHKNPQWRKESRLVAFFLAIGHGLWRDVRKGQMRKDSCDYEGYKGNLKGNLNVDGITEHSTGYHWLICQENKGVVVHTQVSYALSQHNGTLQLSEDNSTP